MLLPCGTRFSLHCPLMSTHCLHRSARTLNTFCTQLCELSTTQPHSSTLRQSSRTLTPTIEPRTCLTHTTSPWWSSANTPSRVATLATTCKLRCTRRNATSVAIFHVYHSTLRHRRLPSPSARSSAPARTGLLRAPLPPPLTMVLSVDGLCSHVQALLLTLLDAKVHQRPVVRLPMLGCAH